MANSLNITLAPQLELTVTHNMGGVAAGFTVIAGISRSTGGGAGNEYLNAEKVKLAGIETLATADQTGAEIKTLYEQEASAFTDAQFTKLAAIEAAATADQSNAEIKAAVEAAADSNTFTDNDHSKLNGIEASATIDQTPTEIRTAVGAATDSNVFTDANLTKLNSVESGAKDDMTGAEIKTAYQQEANAFTDTKNTKLSNIETSATADQTNAEIRTAVEAASDSNVFTDNDHSKLNGIEAGAKDDMSDAEIAVAYGNEVVQISAGEITAGTEATLRTLAPDDLVAMITTHAPAAIASAHYQEPVANIAELTALPEATLVDSERRFVEIQVADYFYDIDAISGDEAPDDQQGGTGFWITVADSGGGNSPASIKSKYEKNANTNAFEDAEKTKLATVETGATADQTGAEIKSLYEAEASAFTDTQFTKLGTIEGSATADQTNAEIRTAVAAATNSNVFTDAQQTSLGTMEDGATADQSNAEIRAAVAAATDSNVFTDADHSKLDAVEASATADQSDAEIATAYAAINGQVSGGEITAGSEVTLRTYSPADIVAIIAAHESVKATAVNYFTDDHTLALTDVGDIVEMDKATANVLSIPLNATVAFPIGTVISVSMIGVGVTSITGVTGVTLNRVSAGSGEITGQDAGVSLYKRATDVWLVQGAIGTVS